MSGWNPDRTVVVTGGDSPDAESMATALAAESDMNVVTVAPDALLSEDVLPDADALVVVDSPPVHDGINTFRQVRDASLTLPVLVVAADAAPERVEQALSAGVTEYVSAWTDDRAGELAARVRAHIGTPALDGAVQADRWQSIVRALAHDARNPLNVVTGRLELLDVEATHSEAIRRSVGRVESLLDELSTVATVTSPVESLEQVDLAQLATTVWAEQDAPADRLVVETDATVDANPDGLRSILERLFENALHHGGPDVQVTLGDTATGFYVADDGAGLPEAANEELFEQGYGTARDGEGYGLFVAAKIAAAHGWDIDATASAAGGARFDVRAR